MPFDANIPQPGDFLSESQQDLLSNFLSMETTYGINHVPFSQEVTNRGKHKFVEMPGDVLPTTTANEGTLYTKTAASVTSLFYTPDNSAKEYQLTTTLDSHYSFFGKNAAYTQAAVNYHGGYTFLPGAMIMQYGILDVNTSVSTYTILFPFNFPTALFNVTFSPIRAASSPGSDNEFWVIDGSMTPSGFQIFNKGAHSFRFMWQAIGN